MAQKILVTNFKGGCGVTTFCIGLGIALARAGERTLIVDGDAVCGTGMLTGGCANMQTYTLADFAKGACRAKQTAVAHPKILNLSFMASLGLEDKSFIDKAVGEVDGLYDYILLDDTPQGRCDGALIVTEPYLPSIKCADMKKAALSDGGIKNAGLVVNKLSGGQILSGEVMTAQEIATLLHLPLRAVIPEDLSMPLGKWKKTTMKAFRAAADTISGKREIILNVLSGYFGINGFIKRKMREKI